MINDFFSKAPGKRRRYVADPFGRVGQGTWEDDDRDPFGRLLEKQKAAPRADVSRPFNLKDRVGMQGPNARDDVAKVETLLGRTGHMDLKPTQGATGFPGTRLVQGIKAFQKDNGLKVDGFLKPKGETLQALKAKTAKSSTQNKAPIFPAGTATKAASGKRSLLDAKGQDRNATLRALLKDASTKHANPRAKTEQQVAFGPQILQGAVRLAPVLRGILNQGPKGLKSPKPGGPKTGTQPGDAPTAPRTPTPDPARVPPFPGRPVDDRETKPAPYPAKRPILPVPPVYPADERGPDRTPPSVRPQTPPQTPGRPDQSGAFDDANVLEARMKEYKGEDRFIDSKKPLPGNLEVKVRGLNEPGLIEDLKHGPFRNGEVTNQGNGGTNMNNPGAYEDGMAAFQAMKKKYGLKEIQFTEENPGVRAIGNDKIRLVIRKESKKKSPTMEILFLKPGRAGKQEISYFVKVRYKGGNGR